MKELKHESNPKDRNFQGVSKHAGIKELTVCLDHGKLADFHTFQPYHYQLLLLLLLYESSTILV